MEQGTPGDDRERIARTGGSPDVGRRRDLFLPGYPLRPGPAASESLDRRLQRGLRRRYRRVAPVPARAVIVVGCVLALALAIGLTAAFQAAEHPLNPGLTFTIAEGTSATIAVPGIDSAVAIPTEIVFGPDDEASITIINRDSVMHRAGPFLVAPGQVFVQRFPNEGRFGFACAVDRDEDVTVTVER